MQVIRSSLSREAAWREFSVTGRRRHDRLHVTLWLPTEHVPFASGHGAGRRAFYDPGFSGGEDLPTDTLKGNSMARDKDSKKRRKQQKKKNNKLKKKCPHCSSGRETFRFMQDIFNFDVDLAREIVNDGREPTELDHDDVEYSVDICRIYPEHVKHVNPEYPGIVAHYWYPEPDGTVLHGHVVIDGHHRAARCLKDGLPYRVHILSEEESRRVMMTGPDIDSILADLDAGSVDVEQMEPAEVGC